MLKVYFKQALGLMRQNKLFSGIYIFGTGFAIAFTTVMVVMLYVKVAPLYPEYDRYNTYYLNRVNFEKGNQFIKSGVSHRAVKEWFYTLENARFVTAVLSYKGKGKVQTAKGKSYKTTVLCADPAFFRMYSYRFVEGKPFSQADFTGGLSVAAVSDEVAVKLFGTISGAVGKTFKMDFREYRICGVFEEPSRIMKDSYAGVIIPYTAEGTMYTSEWRMCPYFGSFSVRMLCENKAQGDALKAEMKELERKINTNAVDDDFKVSFLHYPISQVEKIVNEGEDEFNVWKFVAVFGSVFIVLLIIPALNLSGMISGRMDMRCQELGVRKSFGATRGALLGQVMWENMVLTLAGGIFGLIITIGIVYFCKEWIFSLLDGDNAVNDVRLTGEMLFSPVIFILSFLVCVLLNFMSALFPAWNALRRPVVDLLNEKK